jgi:hypothetical protein
MKIRLELMLSRARKAGVELPADVTWHSLRRTHATLFAQANPHALSELIQNLGHHGYGTLHHYVRPDRDFVNQRLDRYYQSLLP